MLRELQDDDTGLEELPDEWEIQDPLEARRAIIRLGQLERDLAGVKDIKKGVAAEYDRKAATIERDITRVRDTLRAFVFRHGKLSFPDVGTAYKRKTDPKLEIVDREAFEAELGAMFRKDSFDETAAKAFALEQALDAGVIIPGTELVPAGEDLTVRKA
jgi:hypothetical protein